MKSRQNFRAPKGVAAQVYCVGDDSSSGSTGNTRISVKTASGTKTSSSQSSRTKLSSHLQLYPNQTPRSSKDSVAKKRSHLRCVNLTNRQMKDLGGSSEDKVLPLVSARRSKGKSARGHNGKGYGNGAAKERHRGGATGGGGGSGDSGGSGDDGGSGDNHEKAATKWKKIKKSEATHKATHDGIDYYKTKLPGKEGYVWISWDYGHHADSYFKVWIDKKNKICFDSSYDANLMRMDGKHESNKGREIMKRDMKITELHNKKK